jgi:uncharacterized protein YoxC
MNTKELYKQKLQAQLDEWKADVAKLKAKTAGEAADAQLLMQKQFSALEDHIEETQAKIAELADASEEAWESVKTGVESAWSSLKTAVSDAVAKFKA